MDDSISNFYVTLPSTASMHYFPNNTQSLYRTKLNTPLMLNGDWEVAMSEICMPRSWFNIDEHNNTYSIVYDKEEIIIQDETKYPVKATYRGGGGIRHFWTLINDQIENYVGREKGVRFIWNENTSTVDLQMDAGFEIIITTAEASKLLYMLHLPSSKNLHQKEGATFTFRRSTVVEPLTFTIYLINKNPISVTDHHVSIMPYLGSSGTAVTNPKDFFDSLNYNLMIMDLQEYVRFLYNESKNMVTITISPHAELHLSKTLCPTLMRILNLKPDLKADTVLKGTRDMKVKFTGDIRKEDEFGVVVKLFPTSVEIKKITENLIIPPGMYKKAEDLFQAFSRIQLNLKQNMHVALNVPPNCEVTLNRNLADMLGFKKNVFKTGFYFGDYSLQLHAGITEIFVYSDVIQSVHVGDSVSPLLRIIPCMNETKPQIVKYYDRPLYIPIRNNFLETIEIDLRSSTGEKITFTAGKTYVVLSFRRKPIK